MVCSCIGTSKLLFVKGLQTRLWPGLFHLQMYEVILKFPPPLLNIYFLAYVLISSLTSLYVVSGLFLASEHPCISRKSPDLPPLLFCMLGSAKNTISTLQLNFADFSRQQKMICTLSSPPSSLPVLFFAGSRSEAGEGVLLIQESPNWRRKIVFVFCCGEVVYF